MKGLVVSDGAKRSRVCGTPLRSVPHYKRGEVTLWWLVVSDGAKRSRVCGTPLRSVPHYKRGEVAL